VGWNSPGGQLLAKQRQASSPPENKTQQASRSGFTYRCMIIRPQAIPVPTKNSGHDHSTSQLPTAI